MRSSSSHRSNRDRGEAISARVPSQQWHQSALPEFEDPAQLPADHQIDLEKVEKVVGKSVSLDRESEFKSLFPDSAIGAMPPFGNLYGLPTLVDKHLAEQDYIVFEAGTHTDAIIMNYRDYEKIVNPQVEDLSIKLHPMKGA